MFVNMTVIVDGVMLHDYEVSAKKLQKLVGEPCSHSKHKIWSFSCLEIKCMHIPTSCFLFCSCLYLDVG